MKVVILGVGGMLGHVAFNVLAQDTRYSVIGTARSAIPRDKYPDNTHIIPLDVLNQQALTALFVQERPDWVINCVGVIKQQACAKDPLTVLPINAMLPHQLSQLCELSGAKLLHISTDCVFSGERGGYLESDSSDAKDLYGQSKYMGELHDKAHAVTLRTSIIGHELNSNLALLDWFLSQEKQVFGYTNAIFSGLTTLELSHVIRDHVLPAQGLQGLYQVASKPIDKYALLTLVKEVYAKKIEIVPDDTFKINRSLNADKFTTATGYVPPAWPAMIQAIREGAAHV